MAKSPGLDSRKYPAKKIGVPAINVALCVRVYCGIFLYSSGLAAVMLVMPTTKGSQKFALWPKTWNSGSTDMKRSSSVRLNTLTRSWMLEPMLRWVSCTPLGSFSLPLVNRMTKLSSSCDLGSPAMIRRAGSLAFKAADSL
ncbi:MAG: hypothetical protein BWY83_02798 [bacterium ADurb.Bin478]|nr:MAG: hypothetical protein BWY83_02798 [bacterium ADurb.Bin478]